MDASDLLARLDAYPRVRLANYPTPLEPLPRLSRELGRPLFVKRDDVIGPGMGGNKTRKLEYLLAEAQTRGATRVATFGGLQSNHARITAAAARQCGMEPHVLYFERRPPELTGNLLVNSLLGARLHFVPLGGSAGGMTVERASRLARVVALALIGPHYFIPVGGHSALGALGYARAAVEVDRQARDLGIERGRLVVAAGSGGTLAGLLAGLTLLRSPLGLLGIDVGRLWRGFPRSIAALAEAVCARVGERIRFPPECAPLIEGRYVGPAYAASTDLATTAIRRLARAEGILLDPVYTGKAFGGMLDLIERDEFGRDEPLIFLHTGGAPALFAFGRELL